MQENQTSVTPTIDSPQPTILQSNDQKPKVNNFLVGLLSILLILATLIAGYFAYQTQQLVKELQMMKSESKQTPEPTLEPVATPDPTEQWEVYDNEENGYTIKFPSESYIRLACEDEELTATVRLETDTRQSPIEMGSCNRGGKYELETKTYSSIQPEPEESKYYLVEKREVLIDGNKGNLYIHTFTNIEDGPYAKWYVLARINKDNKTYEVSFSDKQNLDLFNQILSTFKFTN